MLVTSYIVSALLWVLQPPGQVDISRDVFINARIIPITDDEISNGYLLIENGRIVDVGPMANWSPPSEETTTHDCSGRTIMPGLVCTHSHIGIPVSYTHLTLPTKA